MVGKVLTEKINALLEREDGRRLVLALGENMPNLYAAVLASGLLNGMTPPQIRETALVLRRCPEETSRKVWRVILDAVRNGDRVAVDWAETESYGMTCWTEGAGADRYTVVVLCCPLPTMDQILGADRVLTQGFAALG